MAESTNESEMALAPEDIALFRRTVGPVKRLHNHRVHHRPPRPRPVPLQTQRQHQEVLYESITEPCDISLLETGDELVYAKPNLDPSILRRLRRGEYAVEGRLDLHGKTTPLAKLALSQFIQHCLLTGRRCVLVIHGKGLGSPQKMPVLKGKLNYWLQQRDDVLAFCSARHVDGGTGAIYLLLRRGY